MDITVFGNVKDPVLVTTKIFDSSLIIERIWFESLRKETRVSDARHGRTFVFDGEEHKLPYKS